MFVTIRKLYKSSNRHPLDSLLSSYSLRKLEIFLVSSITDKRLKPEIIHWKLLLLVWTQFTLQVKCIHCDISCNLRFPTLSWNRSKRYVKEMFYLYIKPVLLNALFLELFSLFSFFTCMLMLGIFASIIVYQTLFF